jgi:hypothetical protein
VRCDAVLPLFDRVAGQPAAPPCHVAQATACRRRRSDWAAPRRRSLPDPRADTPRDRRRPDHAVTGTTLTSVSRVPCLEGPVPRPTRQWANRPDYQPAVARERESLCVTAGW